MGTHDSTGVSRMEIEVRLATAQDRAALEEFYNREGIEFRTVSSSTGLRDIRETMYVVAAAEDLVVAALKLDIRKDPALGQVGQIRFFEIEDDLERTDLGFKILKKVVAIAEEKGLRALDAVVSDKRQDVIRLLLESDFREIGRDVILRRSFRAHLF